MRAPVEFVVVGGLLVGGGRAPILLGRHARHLCHAVPAQAGGFSSLSTCPVRALRDKHVGLFIPLQLIASPPRRLQTHRLPSAACH